MSEGPYKLPEGWRWVRLGEIFDLQQGASMSPSRRLGRNPKPFLRTKNVLWGFVDVSNLDEMDFTEEEITKLCLQPGDLLVCEGGEVGRTAIWEGQLPVVLYQNHIHRLRRKSDQVEPAFFMYWMQAAYQVFRAYQGAESRTAIPNLSGRRLKSFLAPLPPLSEQRRIVARIEELMARVREAKRLRQEAKEDTERLWQAVLAETFPRPGAELPKGWRWVKIEEVTLDAQPGFAFGKKKIVNGDLLHIRPFNIGVDGELDLSQKVYIPSTEVKATLFSLEPGDVLFNNTNSIELVGKTAIVREPLKAAWSNHITRLRPDTSRCEPGWLAFSLYVLWLQGFFARNCNKWIGQAGFNTDALKATEIPLPPLSEQRRIVAHLEAVQAKIRALKEAQAATDAELQRLEQAILEKAFRGEL
ncbi:restriction endonuclease subunit S [Thermoflexus sp.]|uniref:restriction endonuclease subunit S n=1 Tax=Thermoflexus sp. TaxID=1969742 RepID=UPI0035E45D9C